MNRKIILGSVLIILILSGSIFIKLSNDNRQDLINNSEITSIEKDFVEENSELENDNGIFSDYYILAKNKLKTMTLDEKINQLFLVRYPDDKTATDIQKKYQFGGYIFFEKDFSNKSKQDVKDMINRVQDVSKIPILTAVDEEGGSVVRISTNEALVSEKFKSPSELYKEGGFALIRQDTINKSNLLSSLGLNLNLAPVVDVSTSSEDYIFERSIQEDTIVTSEYAKTVIEASKENTVSYVLKHFPGYGNNSDTHMGEVIDNRSYQSIVENDLPPFISGIESGAEAILISHNIVTNIDKDYPASLSLKIHDLLRDELKFTGIIIADNLDMEAIEDIEEATIRAIEVGNNLIITTDYQTSVTAVKNALNDKRLTESQIDNLTLRVIEWKYYKGLLYENQK